MLEFCVMNLCRLEDGPIQLRSHYIFLVYINASHTAAPEDLSRVCECMLRVVLPKDHKCIHLMVFHWSFFRSLYSLHLFSWRLISLPDVALNVHFVHVSPQVYICFCLFRRHYLYCWLVPIVLVMQLWLKGEFVHTNKAMMPELAGARPGVSTPLSVQSHWCRCFSIFSPC